MKNGKGHAHSRFFRALTRGTDNLRLRTKMILLSITCVLIPVIATNCIFWSMVYSSEQTRINSQIKDVYVGTQYRLDSLRESVATMIATFYTNSGVYEFLDREYESELEFFNASRQFSEAFNVVYGNNTYIKKYVLYADNDSLVNGGRVGKLSSVRDTDWYRYYKESGRESAVYAYYDDLNDVRTISVIRRLGYGRKAGDRECLIKLDLSYSYYSRMLSQQQTNTDIYICSGDYIIFSNTDSSNGAVPFRPVSELSTESAAQTFRYNIFDTEWMVYMYQSEESLDMTGLSMIADRWPLLMGMVLINLLLPTAALLLISRSITSRLRLLAKHMEMVEDETFEEINIYPSRDELGDLVRHYNNMTRRIRELIQDVYKERFRRQENELQKQRAELCALHSQINPHFMFNALESIRMRSLIKGEDETAEIIELLAVMMRKSTDWGSDMVTVFSEAAFAETYLKLQQYRFGSRLSYRINIAPDCAGCLVPKLSIVTFVENACVHGVEGVKRDCIIILSVEREDGLVRICVEDTGAGMSEERCAAILGEMRDATFDDLNTSRSVGIINACLRLKKCFGDGVTFEIDSEEGAGVCITISIPTENIRYEEGN